MPQRCCCDGYLTKDVELKYSEKGNPYAYLRLRIPAGYQKDGKDVADFISFKAFGKVAEDAGSGNEGDYCVVDFRLREEKQEVDGKPLYTRDAIVTAITIHQRSAK